MTIDIRSVSEGQILYIDGQRAKITNVLHTFENSLVEAYIYSSDEYVSVMPWNVLTDI